MTDTQPNQAMPTSDAHKGENKGIANPSGRVAGGESGGGAYPNPQTGKKPESGGFMGHGGQTGIDYLSSEGGEENAATGAE